LNLDHIDTGFCGGPKELSRAVMEHVDKDLKLSDVDRLDKHLDIIVYSIGSIFKLGLDQKQMAEALYIVSKKNLDKNLAGKDEYGKQMKPKDFVGPEQELEKILEMRDVNIKK
jgi:predicted transcriptional regulator of viral defense system